MDEKSASRIFDSVGPNGFLENQSASNESSATRKERGDTLVLGQGISQHNHIAGIPDVGFS